MNDVSIVNLGDVVLHISDQVFSPSHITRHLFQFLQNEHADKIKGKRVLEVGSGSGALSILCRQLGASEVVAAEINNHALIETRKNWHRNGLSSDKLLTFKSNVYDGLPAKYRHQFDLIISNPPMLPAAPSKPIKLSRANTWNGAGAEGRSVLNRIIDQSSEWLQATGKLLFATTTYTNFPTTVHKLNRLKEQGRLANWRIAFETSLKLHDHQRPHIAFWIEQQQTDHVQRIYKRGGDYYYKMMIIEMEC